MTATTPAATPSRSLWWRLYHGETNYQFVTQFKRFAFVSLAFIVLGLISLGTRGLNLGIDFKGGVVWEVPAGHASVSDAQDALGGEGLKGLTVQTLTAKSEVRLRVSSGPVALAKAEKVSNKLAELTGSKADSVSLNSVGPSWGSEISKKALRALIVFLIAITIYITLRFEFRMAIPTLIALVHDVLLTVGVYSIVGFEVTPATVIAILTILGFSIYDGIVVFDKVDENTKLVGSRDGMTYGDMVNLSLNQVLMRSLNTSLTAVLPVASLLVLGSYVLGATTLEEFALALLIGLFAGAYSSIFIASPLLAVLKEREPRYRDIRARVEAKREAAKPSVVAKPVDPSRTTVTVPGDGDRADGEDEPSITTTPAPPPPPGAIGGERIIPPRPRKKGRKR